jgi:hypothetical protein
MGTWDRPMRRIVRSCQPFCDEPLLVAMPMSGDLAGGLPPRMVLALSASTIFLVEMSVGGRKEEPVGLVGAWSRDDVRVSVDRVPRPFGPFRLGHITVYRLAFPDRPDALLAPFAHLDDVREMLLDRAALPWARIERGAGVEVDDHGVTYRRGDGVIEAVRWEDLGEVRVMTTADGPIAEDVFYVLIARDESHGVALPQSRVSGDLLARLQSLPGFDNEAMITAMTRTDEASFTCWRAS